MSVEIQIGAAITDQPGDVPDVNPPLVAGDALLLENGDYLLLEGGTDKLLLEV